MNKDNLFASSGFFSKSDKRVKCLFLSHAEGFGDVDILLEIVVFLELGTVIVLFPIGFGNIAAVDEQGTD